MLKRLAKLSGIASGVIISILVLLLNPFFQPLTEGIEYLLKQDPAATNITKVIDGHNQILLLNGKTSSSNITLFFQAHQSGKKISNDIQFECMLDSSVSLGEQYTECNKGNSHNYLHLTSGDYNFLVKVKDTNAKRIPEPASFPFTVLPSYIVRGDITQNNSTISDAKIIMDNNFYAETDDIGSFNILDVNFFTKENNIHNFTIHIKNKHDEKIKCETQRNLKFVNNNIAQLDTINLDNTICSNSNLDTSSPSSSIGNIKIADFKPEKYDTVSSKMILYITEIDLLYNTTLIKKPTSQYSDDGIWNVVIYLDGLHLDKVSNVTYYLHSDVITINSATNSKFALHFSAYGGFKFFAKVFLKDGGILDLSRYLLLDY